MMKTSKSCEKVRVILHYGECDLCIEGEKAGNSPGTIGVMDM